MVISSSVIILLTVQNVVKDSILEIEEDAAKNILMVTLHFVENEYQSLQSRLSKIDSQEKKDKEYNLMLDHIEQVLRDITVAKTGYLYIFNSENTILLHKSLEKRVGSPTFHFFS